MHFTPYSKICTPGLDHGLIFWKIPETGLIRRSWWFLIPSRDQKIQSCVTDFWSWDEITNWLQFLIILLCDHTLWSTWSHFVSKICGSKFVIKVITNSCNFWLQSSHLFAPCSMVHATSEINSGYLEIVEPVWELIQKLWWNDFATFLLKNEMFYCGITKHYQISANTKSSFPINIIPPKHGMVHWGKIYSCLESNLEAYRYFGRSMNRPTAKYMCHQRGPLFCCLYRWHARFLVEFS